MQMLKIGLAMAVGVDGLQSTETMRARDEEKKAKLEKDISCKAQSRAAGDRLRQQYNVVAKDSEVWSAPEDSEVSSIPEPADKESPEWSMWSGLHQWNHRQVLKNKLFDYLTESNASDWHEDRLNLYKQAGITKYEDTKLLENGYAGKKWEDDHFRADKEHGVRNMKTDLEVYNMRNHKPAKTNANKVA